MVDEGKAKRLLATLTDALADLRRYRESVTTQELKASRDKQHMVLHALYVAVQAAVDLAMHVGADARLPQATSYQDAFHRLAEAGIVDGALAKRLTGWAGFRNVLAHFYAVVDYDRVHAALREISDLEAFAAIVAAQLD